MGDSRGAGEITGLSLLRSFQLRRDRAGVLLPPGAQRLIAFLALQGAMLTRVYVAGTLWIDYSQDAANANLRTALWRLRQLPYPLLETTATRLALASEVKVDLHEAVAIAGRLSAGRVDCRDDEIETLMEAGELLPDWYDDWVVFERERFRQARLHALEELCQALIRERRYGKAIEVGLTAVAGEPLRESAHRAVMRVHLAEGNPTEALRQYQLCRRTLDPLGLAPSREMEVLRHWCETGDARVTAAR